ncbi:hypothetical protein B0H16DRAFT_1463507 [Mycena metata]|uniref:Uncharacterized protein n=1 Tax=Mycena metata TaxID=1033252 RepID=A0AAD7N4C1_9AGAR|nr:hypothetical protein B0H16DRAFT_1463507 [Mycena metata]
MHTAHITRHGTAAGHDAAREIQCLYLLIQVAPVQFTREFEGQCGVSFANLDVRSEDRREDGLRVVLIFQEAEVRVPAVGLLAVNRLDETDPVLSGFCPLITIEVLLGETVSFERGGVQNAEGFVGRGSSIKLDLVHGRGVCVDVDERGGGENGEGDVDFVRVQLADELVEHDREARPHRYVHLISPFLERDPLCATLLLLAGPLQSPERLDQSPARLRRELPNGVVEAGVGGHGVVFVLRAGDVGFDVGRVGVRGGVSGVFGLLERANRVSARDIPVHTPFIDLRKLHEGHVHRCRQVGTPFPRWYGAAAVAAAAWIGAVLGHVLVYRSYRRVWDPEYAYNESIRVEKPSGERRRDERRSETRSHAVTRVTLESRSALDLTVSYDKPKPFVPHVGVVSD